MTGGRNRTFDSATRLPLLAADLSRRRFVGAGAAVLGLAPHAAWAAAARAAGAIAKSEPSSAQSGAQTATDFAQHLTVAVMIEGKGPFRFVVDTGADRTVIAEDVAAALGLAKSRTVAVEGILRTIPAGTVTVGQLSFGPFTRENFTVPVLPRILLECDGYLGLDAIGKGRVTLDFAKQRLDIEYPLHTFGGTLVPPNETRIPVSGTAGHLRATDCGVDGIMTTAFVDTGAEVSVGNTALFAALAETHAAIFEPGIVELRGVTGGTADGRVTFIKRIRMHGFEFTNGPLVIADMQIFDLWGLADTPALLIGMNYLRQFARVSIDYGLEELRFDFASTLLAARA